MRFTKPQGRMEEPPSDLATRHDHPLHLHTLHGISYGFIIMTEEGEKKLARLEKRLVENVDFDNQALHILGFHTDIFYMLGHRGWVQFPNRVSSLSFRLEGVEQVGPYEYIRELLGFQKGAPEQVDVHGDILEGFWSMIAGEAHQ
jgi:hypothetical protein